MKNCQTCILLTFLVTSCSFSDLTSMSSTPKPAARSVASVESQTCGDLVSFLIGRRNLYSETQFENEVTSLGFGHVYHSMKVKAREKGPSEPHQALLSKMQQHFQDGADVDQFLSQLDEAEKRLLWRDVIRPETFEIEEQMLSQRAIEGDDIAAFLLEVPRGSQRENAESAVILMKQMDPEIDDATVVARLQRELGACLTR